MAEQKMLKFVTVGRDMPPKRAPDLRREDFNEIYAEYARTKAEEQSARCSQCGRALLPVPLPAAQQHPRLAAARRRGAAGRGLRSLVRDQYVPRDLRPDLPAGPPVRRQLRHREVGPRHRHHRLCREVHHRHRVGAGLGQADPPAGRAPRKRGHQSARGPAGWPRRRCCARPACR